MIKENVNGFNMLVTNGDEKDVSTKDKYCSHLWIHNNILNKNHTSLKYEIIFIRNGNRSNNSNHSSDYNVRDWYRGKD